MNRSVIFILVIAFSLIQIACGGTEALDVDSVTIDTIVLPYSWQAN
jgi:hypothetical protein